MSHRGASHAVVVGIAAALVAGCGQMPAPSSTAATSSAAGGSGAPAELSCRLPIFGVLGYGATRLNEGAFISFPSAQAQIDPASELVSGHTVASPVLYGTAEGSFDRAAGRWVPVPINDVSPDGTSYTYAEKPFANSSSQNPFGPTRIHVVDVATGRNQVVYDQGYYDIAAYESAGIYLVHHVPQTDGSEGVYLLDPIHGTLKTITAGGVNWTVVGGAGWSADVAPGTAAPPGKMTGNRLLRLDLASGSVAPWFADPGFAVTVLGVGAGVQVLVQAANDQHVQLWLMSSPGSATKIYEGGGWQSGRPGFQPGVADRHGFWLVEGSAVYLYATEGGLKKVADTPFNANDVRLGGACF
jgi:hypothetical protein